MEGDLDRDRLCIQEGMGEGCYLGIQNVKKMKDKNSFVFIFTLPLFFFHKICNICK